MAMKNNPTPGRGKFPMKGDQTVSPVARTNHITDSEKKLGSAYCLYIQSALALAVKDHKRKQEKVAVMSQLKFLQEKVVHKRTELLDIQKQVKRNELMKKREQNLRENIECYRLITENIDEAFIDRTVLELESEVEGLPLRNFTLPKTEQETENIQATLIRLSKLLEEMQHNKDQLLPATNVAEHLQQIDIAGKSIKASEKCCRKKLDELSKLTRELMFLEIALKKKPFNMDFNLEELLKDGQ